MLLNDFIKHTVNMIDAYLENWTLGTLVAEEDGKIYLQLDIGELIELDDNYEIEIIVDGKYHPITYQQAINTFTNDGWLLYAGFYCRVRPHQKQEKKEK